MRTQTTPLRRSPCISAEKHLGVFSSTQAKDSSRILERRRQDLGVVQKGKPKMSSPTPIIKTGSKPPFRPAQDDTKPPLRDPILRSDPIETEEAVLRLPPLPVPKPSSQPK